MMAAGAAFPALNRLEPDICRALQAQEAVAWSWWRSQDLLSKCGSQDLQRV